MPLFKTLHIQDRMAMAIWKVTETEAELHATVLLNPHCQQRFNGMKSDMHRRAFLSIRHLMALYGYSDNDLFYDEIGKPHLTDGTKISITHSHQFTAIILGTGVDVGIDIEKQRDKILRIAHKFTPIREYRTLANSEALVRKLTMVWGAKESLYKIYGQKGLSFLQHIVVSDFELEALKTTAEIRCQGKIGQYMVHFLEFEGFTCAYAHPVD